MDATAQPRGQGGGIGGDESGRYGVLLYYKYAEVPDAAALAAFYESHCSALALVGRVRVGPDGVNATLGGRMAALEKHVAEMSSNALFDGTDFKLASCEDPVDERVARECGFTSLSVRLVKELVTLCANPSLATPQITCAGRHLSAAKFHSVLQSVGATSDSEATVEKSEVVVLDARNVYETRIGKFRVPNVETLDPEIRQYSDLPLWIDEHAEKLRGKSIMMCTAQEVYGVRWHRLISAQKVKALRTYFSYMVAFRDTWSDSQMVAILKGRILYLTIGFQWEA